MAARPIDVRYDYRRSFAGELPGNGASGTAASRTGDNYDVSGQCHIGERSRFQTSIDSREFLKFTAIRRIYSLSKQPNG